MILPAHNAHLLQIDSGISVPDDPVLNPGGGPITPTTRWTGDCQVNLSDTLVETVRGGASSEVLIYKKATNVQVPGNLRDSSGTPIEIEADDVLTIRKQGALEQPVDVTQYRVQQRNESFWGIGVFSYICIAV